MDKVQRIGVLTGGGDAPGLNAVIRAVVKSAINRGLECYGIPDSFDGLIEVEILHGQLRHRRIQLGAVRHAEPGHLGGKLLGLALHGP